MTPEGHAEALANAVDAILSRPPASASEVARGISGDDAIREKALVLAGALAEVRAAYDEVDAPFVFDPQAAAYVRRRVTVRSWRAAGALLAAAAAIALLVVLPTGLEDGAPRFEEGSRLARELSAQPADPTSEEHRQMAPPTVLSVRTPRLAIVLPVESEFDGFGGADARRPHGASILPMSFARLRTARLSTTAVIDKAPSSFPRSPSMIFKPRRKSHDDNANDDMDRGGSSGRQLGRPERLG